MGYYLITKKKKKLQTQIDIKYSSIVSSSPSLDFLYFWVDKRWEKIVMSLIFDFDDVEGYTWRKIEKVVEREKKIRIWHNPSLLRLLHWIEID